MSEYEPNGCPTPGACYAAAELAALRAENARLRGALEEFLDDSGYSHMTDNELNFEIEQGNGRAPIILRARAALAIVG